MKVFRFFLRTYPAETAVMLACLLAAAVFEGISWSAAVPLLGLAAGEDAPDAGFEAAVREILAGVGLSPTLGVLACIVGLGFALKAGVVLLAKRQIGYTVAHVATDLRLDLLRSLLSARWSYYTRQPAGAAANALATEAERASLAYHYGTQVLAFAIESTLYVAIALAVSWQITVGAMAITAVLFGSLSALVRMAGRAGRRQTRLLKALLSRLIDALQAVKLLKATGREDLMGPLLEADTRTLNQALRRRIFSKEALRALQEPIVVIPGLAGAYLAVTRLEMPFASVLVLGALFARTLNSVNKLQRKLQSTAIEASALFSLREMIERAEAQREEFDGTREPSLETGVELRGVQVERDGRVVLDGLSIEIPAGQITALIGSSGTGKTTVADLVAGLILPDAGEVRVDGVPLPEIDLRRWRRMLGYVPQEVLMLHDSVRVNVSLGDPTVDDPRIEDALRDAGAWDFVSKLPEGVDSSVGERGALLSGGQRQRLALARALAHGARLLVLDEATAALDPENEREVWATVARLHGRVTVLAISHQQALADVADRIYRVEGGVAVPVVSAPR